MENLYALHKIARHCTWIFLLFIGMIFSCKPETKRTDFERLNLGEIEVRTPSDTCGDSKCFHFTITSDLAAEPQGGIIRIDEPTGKVLGTIVMFSGGFGNFYFSNWEIGARLIAEFQDAGYRVIQVKWDKGWFLGSPGKYEGFKKLAVHPATVTQYIYDELAEKEKPYVLFGGSGGAAQIAYMLSFYGIDNVANAVVAFGGFWMGRIDIGCFDTNALNKHMHYTDFAKSAIDRSFGFDSETKGPCERGDTTFVEQYRNSSVSFGGNYHYPNTHVYLIYAGNDGVGALNQGLTYYHELVNHKSPFVHMQIVDGAPHPMLNDSTGYAVLRDVVLAQLPDEPANK